MRGSVMSVGMSINTVISVNYVQAEDRNHKNSGNEVSQNLTEEDLQTPAWFASPEHEATDKLYLICPRWR